MYNYMYISVCMGSFLYVSHDFLVINKRVVYALLASSHLKNLYMSGTV